MEYTKGNWEHKEDGVIMVGDHQIACVMPKDREANAHLIAAAPAMYEALKFTQDWLEINCDNGYRDLNTVLNKALAKAEGV